MSDIKWLPDGQKTFEKLMAAVPDAMRDTMRPKLLQMLGGKVAGEPVSKKMVEDWVKEDLPEPQKRAHGGTWDQGCQQERRSACGSDSRMGRRQ